MPFLIPRHKYAPNDLRKDRSLLQSRGHLSALLMQQDTPNPMRLRNARMSQRRRCTLSLYDLHSPNTAPLPNQLSDGAAVTPNTAAK